MFVIIIFFQLLICFLAVVTSKKNIGKWIIFFNAWWIFLLLFNYVFPFGNYSVSDKAYICFGLFLFFTTFGYLLFGSKKESKYLRNSYDTIEQQFENIIINNKMIKLIILFSVVLLLYYAYRYSVYMGRTSVLNARLARFYVGNVFSSIIELLFFNYIISASRFLFAFIIAFGVVFGKIHNFSFVFSVVGLVVYSYIGGSRFPFVLLTMEIIFLFIINKESKLEKNALKRIIRFFLIMIVGFLIYFFMLYFTAYRLGMKGIDKSFLSSASETLYDQIIGYNIGPLSSFSSSLDSGILYNHYYFGRCAVLNGVDELISNILSFIGIHFRSARYAIGEIAAQQVSVGEKSFNALYTSVYWFFADLGFIGISIYSFVFGAIEKKVVVRFYKEKNIWTLMLVLHCLYFLIMSNFTWEINTMDSLVYIIFLFVFVRKKCYFFLSRETEEA
ncbi:MAG TPA: hypothetical protein DCW44_05145 [Eubacterium sp.]|nr:hypothetical protein [Eubacterium sp.]